MDEYFPFFLFLYLARYVKGIKDLVLGWEPGSVVPSWLELIVISTPLVLGVGVGYAPET